MLSLGFKPAAKIDQLAIGITLPSLVDTILEKLGDIIIPTQQNELQSLFLTKVSSYGSISGNGYFHDEMKNLSAYQSNWQHGFLRIYDMNDEAVQVLRRSDINRRGHVVFDSLRFVTV